MRNLIFAVDDEQPIRELYSYVIKGADMDSAEFSCGEELFEALKTTRPQLILLDVMLENISGFDILAKLKENSKTSDIPVIMVSAKGDEISKVKGLTLGADDYVSKPFGALELVARIKANIRKHSKSSIIAYKDITIDDDKHQVQANGIVLTLTVKEYDLLKKLIENKECVYSRNDLLNEVWGYDFVGETRTIDIHIANLRKILSAAKSSAMIETIRKIGYMIK